MTRQLLDGATGAPPPLPGTPPPLLPTDMPPTAAQAAPALQPEPEQTKLEQQALAGALPGWDLLPATGFVRRKR